MTLKDFLEHIAYELRVSSLISTTEAGSGHPTSSLSAADIVAALFFYAMEFDSQDPNNPNNDRFILSKGHAAPVLYAVWKELGVLSAKDLLTLRKFKSILEGHPTLRFSRSEAATGSLGQGLSIGVGMSYAAKMDNRNYTTYVLMGDSEITEGSIWEAIQLAPYYRLDNLVGIVDCNRLGQSTDTIHGHNLTPYVNKFSAFGWKTFVVDGHDMKDIMEVLEKVRNVKGQPSMIIAKTIKGYGVEFAENEQGFHGKAFSKEKLDHILKHMEKRFSKAAHFPESFDWNPNIPKAEKLPEKKKIKIGNPKYKKGEEIPTRKIYGQVLAEIGNVSDQVVSLDAEVKNSTYAEVFEKAHPKRFVQCFIAEQNMVGMGVGMAARGKIPFLSTFAAFFSRAYDQIRMAAIGESPLRLVGSHAGVSIGEDGPSQMGLEDIALMRAIPNSIVLYPSDAVSTWKLAELMANRADGISYMRTTRAATPIIYDNSEIFTIGGCNVIRQSHEDKVCIIAAGITLFEALKAYEKLKEKDIDVSVIDLYSIKPIDSETILRVAKKSQSKVITVEDHYLQGGLGQAVTYALRNQNIKIECLAVTKMPFSGKPQELLAYEGMDSTAIIQTVEEMIGV